MHAVAPARGWSACSSPCHDCRSWCGTLASNRGCLPAPHRLLSSCLLVRASIVMCRCRLVPMTVSPRLNYLPFAHFPRNSNAHAPPAWALRYFHTQSSFLLILQKGPGAPRTREFHSFGTLNDLDLIVIPPSYLSFRRDPVLHARGNCTEVLSTQPSFLLILQKGPGAPRTREFH